MNALCRSLLAACIFVSLMALPTMTAQAQMSSDGTGGASCHVRGALQDPVCTPGAVLTTDAAVVCQAGYAASVRTISTATRNAVYAEYGISDHTGYVIDHLIALEDGGDTAITNLWPERVSGWPGAGEKDLIEGALHRGVCDGRVALPDAQRWLATDWRAALIEPSAAATHTPHDAKTFDHWIARVYRAGPDGELVDIGQRMVADGFASIWP